MAPWTTRRGSQPKNVHINTSANSNHNSNLSSGDLVSRIHNTALHTPTSIPDVYSSNLRSTSNDGRFDLSNAYADSSSDESNVHPSRPLASSKTLRPQHLRSMSQPFPSLFSGKKKRQGSVGAPPPDLGFADDDVVMSRQTLKQQVPGHGRTPSHPKGGIAGSNDFSTGNCMTCGSLVRWPRELKVFKCTICTTVNDLGPSEAESQNAGGSRWRKDASQGSATASQPAPASVQQISIEQMKRLIHQCIQSHLMKKFDVASRTLPESQAASASTTRAPTAGNKLAPINAAHDHQTSVPSQFPAAQASHYVFDEEPTLRAQPPRTNSLPMPRSYSSSYPERPPVQNMAAEDTPRDHRNLSSKSSKSEPKRIFKPLEDYIISCFGSFECVNSSFMDHHHRNPRIGSEPPKRKPLPQRDQRDHQEQPRGNRQTKEQCELWEMPQGEDRAWDFDPKLLLLGDFAENGTWWAGSQQEKPQKPSNHRGEPSYSRTPVNAKSPQMNWGDLTSWYGLVTNTAESWFGIYEELSREERLQAPTERDLRSVERDFLQGQEHTRRVLLKATELLLKRPGRPLKNPADLRFLLIILENPLLYENNQSFTGILQPGTAPEAPAKERRPKKPNAPESGPLSGQHSGIVKRIVGLISNSSAECHNQLITWFSRYSPLRFVKVKDLVSGFLSYRMLRQSEKKREVKVDITAGLVPQMQEGRSGAYLYDEINGSGSSKKPKEPEKKDMYSEDWQIRASARVLALLFAANNHPKGRRGDDLPQHSQEKHSGSRQERSHTHGQLLATSDFYNSMIDYADLVADFENWETRRGKFSFCQYPFLLSVWAKNHILEYDARRQMQNKARDAFFDSIMSRRNIKQFLELSVRRDCLVDDSLQAVSEVIGSGSEDIKKGLRINFKGEEGVDAGGLRKEWFLLLVREVFNPDHGMFAYDEDSKYCYFNPNSFEASDQFFLVGVVIGLAIYNSTILDVALPPFSFRKLIASAPTQGTGASAHPKPPMRYTLEDLAEYRPRLARGLRQLLDYEGNVEETFCLDFAVDMDKYGTSIQVPLCPGGERMPVTNSNRRDYVDLYVRHIIDVSVTRQFEPFKRGFYTVCGGNALSLFRPDEIELLVRGSDETLDISSLRGVAEYDNWKSKNPDGSEPVVGWFWETFEAATPKDQRKLLLFITGSDRIPAMGAAVLHIRISCLGDDEGRFPSARTCFNMLSLSRYGSKERMEKMLWTAVYESEGFGLK